MIGRSLFLQSTVRDFKKHFEVEIYHDKPTNEILINRISDADIIIPIRERTKFTKEILQQLKK